MTILPKRLYLKLTRLWGERHFLSTISYYLAKIIYALKSCRWSTHIANCASANISCRKPGIGTIVIYKSIISVSAWNAFHSTGTPTNQIAANNLTLIVYSVRKYISCKIKSA